MSERPVFVLVHGAWHGAWCWEFVRARLEETGCRVVTPTLAGCGERAAEPGAAAVRLEDHVVDVARAVAGARPSRAVLVGHSYAGMPITAAAARDPESVSALVFLDAAVPGPGDSMISQIPPEPGVTTAWRARQLEDLAGGTPWMPPPGAAGLGIDDPQLARWVERRLTPHPVRTWTDVLRDTDQLPPGVPRSYVHCNSPVLGGAGFDRHAARLARDPAWRTLELAAGHDCMITHPVETARVLLDAIE